MFDFSEAQTLGDSLRQVKQHLKPGRVWYYGQETYFDLLFDLEEQSINWFQLTLRGRSLTWSRRGNTIHTGYTNELELTPALEYPASKIIQEQQHADPDFIEFVKRILSTRPNETLFCQMLSILNEATAE
jgi:hypothetical protein